MWERFGDLVNSSFYFVIDKITDLMVFFMDQAYAFGRLVLLIAILTAALNYALTRTGLQENLVKILKATLFLLPGLQQHSKHKSGAKPGGNGEAE